MRVLPKHELFIIYSQSEAAPSVLVRELADALLEVGITLPGYEEMDWLLPDPAAHSHAPSAEQMVVNIAMLDAYISNAQCVLVAAQGRSEGVRIELERLAQCVPAPAVLALVWGKGEALDMVPAPLATLRIADWREGDAPRHAKLLRAQIWLVGLLNRLLQCGGLGTAAVADLCVHHRDTATLIAGSSRYPEPLRSAARQALVPSRLRPRGASGLPESIRTEDALSLWREWRGGGALLAAEVARDLDVPLRQSWDELRTRLDMLCAALEQRLPGVLEHDIESSDRLVAARYRAGLRLAPESTTEQSESEAAAVAQFQRCMLRADQQAEGPATAAAALRDFAAALEVAQSLPAMFRCNALVERASLLGQMDRHGEALRDLDEVIANGAGGSEHVLFSAHMHRADIRFELRQWAAAIVDYEAVVADRRAAENIRLSARLRRGVAREMSGDGVAAAEDYRIVLGDPRASASTHAAAQKGLDRLARA
jgi:hypothetical protein